MSAENAGNEERVTTFEKSLVLYQESELDTREERLEKSVTSLTNKTTKLLHICYWLT